MTDTVNINGVEYVPSTQIELGEKRIVVADRGWVFVGNCVDNDDGGITIRDAKNIRQWGTVNGLGELVNGPTDSTVYDYYGMVVVPDPIFSICVSGGWDD